MPASQCFIDKPFFVHAGEQGNLVVIVRNEPVARVIVGIAIAEVLEAGRVVVPNTVSPSHKLTCIEAGALNTGRIVQAVTISVGKVEEKAV